MTHLSEVLLYLLVVLIRALPPQAEEDALLWARRVNGPLRLVDRLILLAACQHATGLGTVSESRVKRDSDESERLGGQERE